MIWPCYKTFGWPTTYYIPKHGPKSVCGLNGDWHEQTESKLHFSGMESTLQESELAALKHLPNQHCCNNNRSTSTRVMPCRHYLKTNHRFDSQQKY